MLAILALGGFALERRLALVADLARSLGYGPLDVSCSALGLLSLRLLLLCRKTRAFLTTCVIAVAADAIHTILGLTAMACTVNPHANFLLHPRDICFERRSPFTNLKRHVIFGKHGAYFLFLYFCIFSSSHCGLRSESHWSRLDFRCGLWSDRSGGDSGRRFGLRGRWRICRFTATVSNVRTSKSSARLTQKQQQQQQQQRMMQPLYWHASHRPFPEFY